MEAARTSETLVNFYQTTRCYNPEDSNLHLSVCFIGTRAVTFRHKICCLSDAVVPEYLNEGKVLGINANGEDFQFSTLMTEK
jgi:hypothetical protein